MESDDDECAKYILFKKPRTSAELSDTLDFILFARIIIQEKVGCITLFI